MSVLFQPVDKSLQEQNIKKAVLLKEQGNKSINNNDYETALTHYSRAILLRCHDPHLNSILYANRAQANLAVEKYGEALADSHAAIFWNDRNVKAYKKKHRMQRWQKSKNETV